MAPPRPCPLCGDRHAVGEECPYAVAEGGADDAYPPLAFGMDPYALFDPAVQAQMAQLAATNEQTETMKRLMAVTAEQNEELKRLRAHVENLERRGGRVLTSGGAGPRARALPASTPMAKFCRFCGGPIRECTPYCHVHGSENE